MVNEEEVQSDILLVGIDNDGNVKWEKNNGGSEWKTRKWTQ